MKYISLNETSPAASAVIAGTMRINQMSPSEADTFVRSAYDMGITMLDTADIYGGGKSETLLGTVFGKDKALREKIFLQTKCAIHDGKYDFSKDYILGAVERSLKRLQTDYIDMLLLHRPDFLMDAGEVGEAFDELERSGKVRSFGVSNENPQTMAYLQSGLSQRLRADQVQLSCAHTPMIDSVLNVNMASDSAVMRDGGVMMYCRQNGIAVQAWSPLQMGFFEGVFLGSSRYAKLNAKLNELAGEYGVSADTIAYAWILRIPGKIQVVTGTSKIEHLKNAARAAEITLTHTQWYDIYKAAGNQLP